MIHTIYVDSDTELAELKKLFRKKLMTGGAVVRISSDVGHADLETIVGKFSNNVQRYSLQSLVLTEVAKRCSPEEELASKLTSLAIPEINRVLASS